MKKGLKTDSYLSPDHVADNYVMDSASLPVSASNRTCSGKSIDEVHGYLRGPVRGKIGE